MTPARQAALDEAIETARQHIPIVREVCREPVGFVIHDCGKRFAVYSQREDAPGGFLPPAPRQGVLFGRVELNGMFTPV